MVKCNPGLLLRDVCEAVKDQVRFMEWSIRVFHVTFTFIICHSTNVFIFFNMTFDSFSQSPSCKVGIGSANVLPIPHVVGDDLKF
jgi:hypothetical protein